MPDEARRQAEGPRQGRSSPSQERSTPAQAGTPRGSTSEAAPIRHVRVVLPAHLRTLAKTGREVTLDVEGRVTQRAVLDALEARYPVLRGAIRDHVTHQRRALVRFFACAQDLSHDSPDAPLPDAVAAGTEPLLIVGAIAGG